MKSFLLWLMASLVSQGASAACQYTVTSARDYIPRPANDNNALNNGQCELFEAVQNVGLAKDVFEDCKCLPTIGLAQPTIGFAGVDEIVFGNGFVEDGKPGAVAGTNEPIDIHPNTVALAIEGPVHLKGNHRTRLFAIGGPSQLTLDQVRMSDGISDYNGGLKPTVGNGGLILLTNSSAKLTLRNLWMVEGEALSGGAIWAGGGEIVMESVSCSKNHAYGTDIPGTGRGGCLHGGDVVTIKDSLFHTNGADHAGGGIDNLDPNAVVDIKDSQFVTNLEFSQHGLGGGGGIFSMAKLQCTNCLFDGNYSAKRGGAYMQGATSACATFVGTHFTGNQVNHTKLATGGGAIYSEGCVVVKQGTFALNYSHEDDFSLGGAIYAEAGSLDVGNSTFYDNFADSIGAAVAIGGDTTFRFANNTVANNDGDAALYWLTDPAPKQHLVINNILVQAGGACGGNRANVVFKANLEFPGSTCGEPLVADPDLIGPSKPLDPKTGLPTAAATLGHRQFVPKGLAALWFKGLPEGCVPSPVDLVDKNGRPRQDYCSLGDLEH